MPDLTPKADEFKENPTKSLSGTILSVAKKVFKHRDLLFAGRSVGLFRLAFLFPEEGDKLPPQLINGVVIFSVGKADSLRVGSGFVNQVIVRMVVGFQLQFAVAAQFDVDIEVANQLTVVGAVGIGIVADIAVDGNPVVEELGAECQFDFVIGHLVPRPVVEANVPGAVNLRQPVAELI